MTLNDKCFIIPSPLAVVLLLLVLVLPCNGGAAEGISYPDSALIRFSWDVTNDTITVSVENLGLSPVEEFFLTDMTRFPCTLIDAEVDGGTLATILVEVEQSSVIVDRYTNRFVTGGFDETVVIRYYSPSYQEAQMSWSAGHPYPVFGISDSVLSLCCAGIRGNIDGDPLDETNIADLVQLVNYMFGEPSGPAPACYDEADMNADGTLDINDLVFLVDYMFAAGILPEQCP